MKSIKSLLPMICLATGWMPVTFALAVLPEPAGAQTRLTPTNRPMNGFLGSSVSMYGNWAAGGAWGAFNSRGAVFLFVNINGNWTAAGSIASPSSLANQFFGYSISLNGNTLLIGSHGENNYQGAAYVYIRSGNVWVQQARLTASDGAPSAFFGKYVSLSGNTAVIAAPGDSNSRGAAYVFVRSGTVWTQQTKLVAADGLAGDLMGSSVALTGNTIVAGAMSANTQRGAAYIFSGSGGSWKQQAKVTAPDGRAFDQFGASATASNSTVMIGSLCGNNCSGAVYVFDLISGVWTQTAELTSAGATNFGSSVSLVGDQALIGGPCADTCNGAAYYYTRQSGVWTQQSIFSSSAPQFDGEYGTGVALGGTTALVGAWGEDNFLGALYAQPLASPCSLNTSLSYASGTLTVNYTLTTSVPAAFSGQLYTLTGNSQLWQENVGASSTPVTGTLNFPLAPSAGVAVYSKLITGSGAVCTSQQSVYTGHQ
jgi:hypothetical protein